jgi:hypothetical protein
MLLCGNGAYFKLRSASSLLSPMSALGQKQTFGPFIAMSALPPIADIDPSASDVRFVPKADIRP